MGKKQLPNLPYGQGSLSYVSINGTDYIRYRKKIGGRYVYVYEQTVQKCLAAMKEKEDEYNNKKEYEGTALKNGSITLLYDGMLMWLKAFKYGKVKSRTYDTLESTLNNQIQYSAIGNMRVSQISTIDIQNEINTISREKSLSTTKKTYQLLKQYFDYYYEDSDSNNPMKKVRPPKRDEFIKIDQNGNIEESVRALSDDEIDRLTKELTRPYMSGKISYKHGYGILFIMWTFCRFGEALALQWKDVDIKDKSVNIYKEYSRIANRDKEGNKTKGYKWVLTTPKTKRSIRNIPVCDRAIECLLMYKKTQEYTEDNDFIFVSANNKPLTDQFLNDCLQKAQERIGIKNKVSIHGLRHTGVSYFIRHGVSDKVVSELAGHADVGITDSIYYNVINEQKKDAIKNINDTLKS